METLENMNDRLDEQAESTQTENASDRNGHQSDTPRAYKPDPPAGTKVDFQTAKRRTLQKNKELYRRLA